MRVASRPERSITAHLLLWGLLSTTLFLLSGCDQNTPTATVTSVPVTQSKAAGNEATKGTNAPTDRIPIYTYEVVNVQPHDPAAFTQGLVFVDNWLLESTGLNGQSSLRRVDLQTGRVLKKVELPAEYFAEGLTVLDDKAFQLTWQNHKGFIYDLASLRLEKEFAYQGEGWGLTTDGHCLILSDGTDQIRFLDPLTFDVKRKIQVHARERAVNRLNELEYVKGEIFANVWGTDYVVRVDPANGRVTGVIDFSGLLAPQDRSLDTDVFNGIAYDEKKDRLFVTGKRWPKLFEVRLKAK